MQRTNSTTCAPSYRRRSVFERITSIRRRKARHQHTQEDEDTAQNNDNAPPLGIKKSISAYVLGREFIRGEEVGTFMHIFARRKCALASMQV